MSGWWFGPETGHDLYWAMNHKAVKDTPPAAGWEIYHRWARGALSLDQEGHSAARRKQKEGGATRKAAVTRTKASRQRRTRRRNRVKKKRAERTRRTLHLRRIK